MSRVENERWIGPFITALADLPKEGDRATLAKLRRGLTDHSAECELWVYAHLHGAAPDHEKPATLLAALFAIWHQGSRDQEEFAPSSLGRSYKRLADELRRKAKKDPDEPMPNVERRLAVLLDSHPNDLPARLQQTVSLLKAGNIPIDWRQLLIDLLDWDREDRPVQRRWAREYWSGNRPKEQVDTEETTARPGTSTDIEENRDVH